MCIGQHSPCTLWRSRGSLQWRAKEEWKPLKPKTRTANRDSLFNQRSAGDEDEDDENEEEYVEKLKDAAGGYHSHRVTGKECVSMALQRIDAPVSVVWSLVRRFEEPQMYKPFVRSCSMPAGSGDVKVGCLRDVRLVSGLPAVSSTERLEILDDERHILSFKVVGGNHRLANYRSIISLHEAPPPSVETNGRGSGCTVVVESYVVEVAEGNTEAETRLFTDTIVKCNLRALARISEKIAVNPSV